MAPGRLFVPRHFSCSVLIGSQSSPGGFSANSLGPLAKQRGRPVGVG